MSIICLLSVVIGSDVSRFQSSGGVVPSLGRHPTAHQRGRGDPRPLPRRPRTFPQSQHMVTATGKQPCLWERKTYLEHGFYFTMFEPKYNECKKIFNF